MTGMNDDWMMTGMNDDWNEYCLEKGGKSPDTSVPRHTTQLSVEHAEEYPGHV